MEAGGPAIALRKGKQDALIEALNDMIGCAEGGRERSVRWLYDILTILDNSPSSSRSASDREISASSRAAPGRTTSLRWWSFSDRRPDLARRPRYVTFRPRAIDGRRTTQP
jgi:hypothetical protein